MEKIICKGVPPLEENTAEAATEILPGMLLKINSDDKVIAHDEAGGIAERIFALENFVVGTAKGIVYTPGERVPYALASRGTYVNALLAPGESVEIGNFLQPGGDGALALIPGAVSESDQAGTFIGTAREEVDNSLGSDPVRILVRIA